MAENTHEIRQSVMIGDASDVGLHRGLRILRNEGINPVVSMEFTSSDYGVLCGLEEVKVLLTKVLPESNREVWALDEGDHITTGEVALRITAPYGTFGLYENSINGILSSCSGWASAARECVTAAEGIPIIAIPARYVHPNVANIVDYSSIIGGCVSCSTILGARLSGTNPASTISPNVALIIGDTLRTMVAFDKHIPQETPRIAPASVLRDEIEESLNLAESLKQKLRGVVLNGYHNGGSVNPQLVKELRARLNIAGHTHVEIIVSGLLAPESITEFIEEGAPVNAFEIGEYIGTASSLSFVPSIHEIDGEPASIRGTLPGLTDNPRLAQIM